MKILFQIIFWIFFIYISFVLAYELVLFIVAKIKSDLKKQNEVTLHSFLIVIPAYKEGEILFNTIDAVNQLKYPSELFDIILLNDECNQEVIEKIKGKIKVIDLELQTHSKIQSLKNVFHLVENYDFIIILDADNLIHPEFLMNINRAITSETKVIQGLRIPKSLETQNEKLDAVTDFIYNQLDRIVPSKIGLTGTLSGSGFAIKSDIFKKFISRIDTLGGFDKILQSELLLNNIPIQIVTDAYVFDEKVKDTKSYIKQRRRWLYYHFYNSFKYGFNLLLSGISKLNLNQIHLGIISLRPPLSMIYVLSFLLFLFALWIEKKLAFILLFLMVIFTLVILNFLRQNKVLDFKLILILPILFLNQLFSISKISEARKDSLKTNHHNKSSIEEILSKEKLQS